MDQPILTQHGLLKLQNELETLRARRSEIADKLRRAKDLGDLSENAEYHEAKEDQGFVEGRILELEELLHRAKVVPTTTTTGNGVTFGSSVRVAIDGAEKPAASQIERTFILVGSNEADPGKGRISSDSPLGKILIGKRVGESVVLTVPRGTLRYTILEIT
jgi:transcription elongation factor GreA